MESEYRLGPWFVANWSRLALPCAIVIIALLPALRTADTRSLVVLALLLPAYMIHQYEEHAHGRFIAFFNEAIGKGRPVLTPASVCLINVFGVWLFFLLCFWLTRAVSDAFAFIPIYLVLVNAATHIAATASLREYNPGLATSVALFVPLGLYLFVRFSDADWSTLFFHLFGLIVALAEHALIVLYAISRRERLATASRPAHWTPEVESA